MDLSSKGEYLIRYRAWLAEYPYVSVLLEKPIQVTIEVDVIDIEIVVFDPEPEWPLSLEDQTIIVGEHLLLQLDEVNTEEYTVSIDLEGERLNVFAQFNQGLVMFEVNGDFVKESDVGIYVIKVDVNFFGKSLSLLTNNFLLNIQPKPSENLVEDVFNEE